MNRKFIYILGCIIALFPYFAKGEFSDELEFGLGVVMVSYNETESGLIGPNQTEPASGDAMLISANAAYHFYKMDKWSLYGSGVFPLLISQGVGIYSGGIGAERYFGDMPHKLTIADNDIKLTYTPSVRYFVGGELSVNFLTYTTETKKKTDISSGLGVSGGITYTFFDNWSSKIKLLVSKDSGISAESLSIRFFINGIYFF